MIIGSGVVIGSGATMGAGNAAPSGNIVFQYVMGNSISFNGQGFDLSYGNFTGPLNEANNSSYMFDTSADYANGSYGNFGQYAELSGNTVTAGNIFVNHGPLSYVTFDGGANGQFIDSTVVSGGFMSGGYSIPSGSSYTIFAVVRVNNFENYGNGAPTGAIVCGNNTYFGFLPPNSIGPYNYPILVANNTLSDPICGDVVTQFQPNTWYAVAITYDSNSQTMTIYTNGTAQTAPSANPATGVAPFTGNEPLLWGTWQGDVWLDGDLAVMTAWDYALSADAISAYTTEYGAPYGITVQRQDNDMPLQTFSQLFSEPGLGTFTVPYGVSNVSIVTVGAGGGGSRDGYNPPGGDTYVYTPWGGSGISMNTNGGYTTAPIITFDCSTGNNATILGNVEPGWLLVGNDFNTDDPNRALNQGNVYGLVTSIDSSNVSNVIIGVYPNVTSTSGGIYNFYGNVIVGAQGAYESPYGYYNDTIGPGPRAFGINADGFGYGGVQYYIDGDNLGGAGAGGYGTSASVVAFDPNQTFVYDNNGDLYTGTANVVLELTNNNLTVAATANNASYPGIATGTYTITGEKVMFSLTVTAGAGSGFQGIGFGNTNANIYSYVGSDTNSGGFYNDGNFYYSGSEAYSGYPTFTTGDVVDIAIDNSNSLGLGQVAFYRVNGGDWLGNPSSDPVTSANGVTVSIEGAIYLMTTQGDQTSIGEWTINTSNTYATPSGYTFIAGLANAGSTGGDGAGYSLPTNQPGQGDGSTIGGSGGGGGGIVYNTGSGGGGTGLYGIGNPGSAGGWVNENEYDDGIVDNTIFAAGAGGGSSAGHSGTAGGVASNWAGGAGGWPGGGGGSGTDYYGAGNGGALAYKNNVSVTPGTQIGIIVGAGGYGGGTSDDTYYSAGAGAGGAVRIVWPGDTRLFPGTNVDADITGGTAFTIEPGDFTYSGSPASSISIGSGTIGGTYTTIQPANDTVAQSLFAFLRQVGVYTVNSLNNGSPNNPNFFNSYIFSVSWAAGSTVPNGLVRMGYDGTYGNFFITTVDPSDTAYQTANPGISDPGGATLPGTFNFPATFTLYSPTTESGGNYWC